MMNEHLDKLAGRAFHNSNNHQDPDLRGSLGVFAEEFARMIVNECCESMSKADADQIKKRFGFDK